MQGRGHLRADLHKHLRTGRAIRRHRGEPRRASWSKIRDMILISERPAEVDDRAVPGHWEGDLIVGINARSAIGTLVERTTRYVMLLHLPNGHSADAVRDAMIPTIQALPEHLRRSLTWDQGTELARHKDITLATDLAIYFCDPHKPWQRGSNENTNGLLRQYFPKSTDLTIRRPERLLEVAAELNGRPRKTLGHRTPAEAFQQLLSDPKQPPVATTP
ncbi:IS30 family transposase [Curtobacterium sp. HSID17257]|uniref:IS30 family transposase n=1 Tax=Curtobacterium sp. HSID17257 TaxID=2419510 RepID=UPI001930F795|nr:IS30 family transposase [Curtobacterium sp. HSID17257]